MCGLLMVGVYMGKCYNSGSISGMYIVGLSVEVYMVGLSVEVYMVGLSVRC